MDEVNQKVAFALVALAVYAVIVLSPWVAIGALIFGNMILAVVVMVSWLAVFGWLINRNA